MESNSIFELQSRTISSFITIMLLGLLLFLISPFYFWRSPGHLFFTYIIPIIPFVVVFDGFISSVRTRTADEVLALVKEGNINEDKLQGWRIVSGEEVHTWPIGWMGWVVG